MTSFSRDPSEWQRLDRQLILNGGIALYLKASILQDDTAWLKTHGYQIYELHCESWSSDAVMHQDFKHILKFPDYYGENLDALKDCLSDLEVPDSGGIALVLHRFDVFAKSAGATVYPHAQRTIAEFLLVILATTTRDLMLTGSRFITMAQSDDPRIQFEKLGSVSAIWNPKEWLNKNRGL